MKNDISIRSYKSSERGQVQAICIATASDPAFQRKEMQELMLTAFCNYYIEKEPQNCFVAADGEKIVGYILCTENSAVWAELFRKEYIPEESPMKAFYQGTISTPMKYAEKYPAHLHIDILPEYQRKGIGMQLMDALTAYLKFKGVPGLMLSVASDNEKGIHFYEKYGFRVLERTSQEIIMGMYFIHYVCNPVNMGYHYQFNKNPMDGSIDVNREAADPSMIYFKDRYYIFASMTLGVLVSDDLIHWEYNRLPDSLPLYGYAPDARVCGEYVYFCANESDSICNFYRTKDIVSGPYEKIEGNFSFSDPNLFFDEDGRTYFYWGLSCKTPIYGVELNPDTMQPIGEKKELIWGNPFEKGFERIGEDNTILPCSEEELQSRYKNTLGQSGITDESTVSLDMAELIQDMLSDAPYIEGAWMNKYQGKYYLQYAAPGTHFNVYGDGVYISEHPLGPFRLAENNPYSYKPGGFIPGAGHGSTMEDRYGNLWHASTMRISINHQFERRVGIWPAGIDKDGELFCNQRYGDWPLRIEQRRFNPWKEPDWYLLSYHKPVKASSFAGGNIPGYAVDEDVRTWWQALGSKAGEWLEIDLGKAYETHAVQMNFADDKKEIVAPPDKLTGLNSRYIEEQSGFTRWILEGSLDQKEYFILQDKTEAKSDLPHDFYVNENGVFVRYIKLTILEVPYSQKPCISGFRVFGLENEKKPEKPEYKVCRTGELDMEVKIEDNGAVGYNILWGHTPDKLYHSCLVFKPEKRIGALVKGREYYVRVDAFNESGITEGIINRLGEEKDG